MNRDLKGIRCLPYYPSPWALGFKSWHTVDQHPPALFCSSLDKCMPYAPPLSLSRIPFNNMYPYSARFTPGYVATKRRRLTEAASRRQHSHCLHRSMQHF